ncbi:MAG: RNA polymerase-associated protein RapA [Chlamydiae bacterium]|nr:RNA polymerase-associated protein RapA [Chlamydiota bacterium]
MLNFRKLKQDFSSSIVKEGREFYENNKVVSAKLLHLDSKTLRIAGQVQGQYENNYECEIEIDRMECETIDSNCDCPYNYDCQHIAALLFHIEQNLDQILVTYSKEQDIEKTSDLDEEEKEELLEKFKVAEDKEVQRQEENLQRQILQEYVTSSTLLASSPFFRPEEKRELDAAEFSLIYNFPKKGAGGIEVQVALRLPFRSKPLHVPSIRKFVEAIRYNEPIFMGGKRFCFSLESFEARQREIVQMVMDHIRFPENVTTERALRIGLISPEFFGMILARSFELTEQEISKSGFSYAEDEYPVLRGIYEGGFDTPLRFSTLPAQFSFHLEYIEPPYSKILLNPKIMLDEKALVLEDVRLYECAKPGMLHEGVYWRFPRQITRKHLRGLKAIRDMTVPEPLFGSFVENSLTELSQFAEVAGRGEIQDFVTLPYVDELEAICSLSYLNGELEAQLHFNYNGSQIPEAKGQLSYDHLSSFVSKEGITARNLVEEQKLTDDLFQDFLFSPEQGIYISKSDKKIVEFMTDVIPRNKERVKFNCPQNLLDQFIYDKTEFALHFSHREKIDSYQIELKVEGALKGVRLDQLWDCIAAKKSFIELASPHARGKKKAEKNKLSKILVLDLERITGIVQLLDELGIEVLEEGILERPLWSLANIDGAQFEGLPIAYSITDQLVEIRKQMIGEKKLKSTPIPKDITAELRSYQKEGVQWLERLRSMFLGGILADDMGLGKTLQAIVALTQLKKKKLGTALIVCPTSLLYNWKEEFSKFNAKLKVRVIDGIPSNRKKLIDTLHSYDAVITSYTLLQKDIEHYREILFSYVILDEAQHIKNRGTRNARSVKMVRAHYKLILSGTPIENSLDELWSLFDFLMPGFLSAYDRFTEKYVRVAGEEQTKNLQYLKKKISPFILRRMKVDVLKDLPPISEIVYHCQLSKVQRELYQSYAESARNELMKLVERDGFSRVQIHVLATLTRLKQICCHPAIFAKEKAEIGDSAKYDMLLELLQTLMEGGHRTVIFSQYTQMLKIMREDLELQGVRFSYLDGSTKNRLEVVKQFNGDPTTSVFLVSLKAGGTGLNLVGADTVIHYDMWWNPAVENQATDRVHRMGQTKSVSAYKLITLGTIEEKIAEMQERKKGLVKKVVSCDDEAIAKLTWEDVLELLKT